MSPSPNPKPKRALISLNLASESERVYQRIDDHTAQDPHDRVRVLESSGPTAESRQLEFVTKPFEKLVDRTVEGVAQGAGKRVGSIEGEVRSGVRREDKGSSAWDPVSTERKVGNRSTASKRNRVWERYDTSEL